MAKVKEVPVSENEIQYQFKCPGCGIIHAFDKRWTFNNDFEQPTFRPSLLVEYTWGKDKEEHRCHSYVTNGEMRFLNDCTHELAGQTVELTELEADN